MRWKLSPFFLPVIPSARFFDDPYVVICGHPRSIFYLCPLYQFLKIVGNKVSLLLNFPLLTSDASFSILLCIKKCKLSQIAVDFCFFLLFTMPPLSVRRNRRLKVSLINYLSTFQNHGTNLLRYFLWSCASLAVLLRRNSTWKSERSERMPSMREGIDR